MIGSLTGKVQNINLDKSNIILNVNGVGYLVYLPTHTIAPLKLDAGLQVYTYTVVRETALELFGFLTLDEEHFFELLISISGVGPKSGLLILSLADIPTLQSAIANNEISTLTKVSGIGKKIAQKIIIELKDKIGDVVISSSGANADDASVIEALEAMGYKQAEAREVVKKLPTDTIGLNARVSAALKAIG
jgi:Holliday junction DNA helicase RuvA